MADRQYYVIVADDEPDAVEAISRLLEQTAKKFKDHIEIFPASTGTETLKILGKHRIDALFLDYHFKTGMSGDDIIDRIADPFENKLIFLISGQSSSDLQNVIIKRHKRLGTRFRFLRKPVDELVIADKYMEMEQFFANRPYPFPISYAISSLQASSTAQAQITAIKDLLEILLRYSVAVLMADLKRLSEKQKPDETSALNRFNPSFHFQQELTMGAWFSWLDNALEAISADSNLAFMPELLSLYQREEDPRSWMRNFKLKVRDLEIGHGFLREEDWYANQAHLYAGPIRSLLSDYLFSTQYALFVREQIELSETYEPGFSYKIRRLMGSEIKPNLIEFQTPARLQRNEVCIYSPTGKILSLYPFILYTNCPACANNHLFYLDKIQEKQIAYTSFCNQRIEDTNASQVFNDHFGSIIDKRKASR